MKLDLLFILILFSFSCCKDNYISLQLEVYRQIYFKYPLSINGKKLDATFYALDSNSDVNLIVAKSSECRNEKSENCYIPESNKDQKKKQKFSLYKYNYTDIPLYKDKVKINNISIGDWEFIFLKEKVTEDYDAIFNFNSKALNKLKKNKNITKEIITYERINSTSINVTIGKDYSTSKFKYYSKSKMEKGIYGCKINKISIASSIIDFEKNKDVKSKAFSNIKAEFYVLEGQDDAIFGPKEMIDEISKFLNESGFKCNKPFSDPSVRCNSDKKGFMNIGDSAIIFNNITFIEKKLDHLYFTLNAIKDLNTIIDVGDRRLIFYSQKENVVLSTSTSVATYALYIFIVIVIVSILGLVFYIFIYAPKKYPAGSKIEINSKYALL